MTDHPPALQRCVAIGALSAAIGVGLGAFGAHGLRPLLTTEMLALFEVGVRYQMYHAGGMIAAGLLGLAFPHYKGYFMAAGWSFGLGTLLFSGTLYLLALTGARWLGAITPLGGILFILGWLVLAAACLRRPGA